MFRLKWFLIILLALVVVAGSTLALLPRVSVNASGTVGISFTNNNAVEAEATPDFDIASISDIPAYGVIEPSGCGEFKGRVKIRFDMFMTPEAPYYDRCYVEVPVIPPEGYPREVDKETGEPLDWDDYNKWFDSLPTVWQNNPFHSHMVYFDTTVSDDTIKAKLAEVTEYFYAFHLYCWEHDYTFLSQWVKVPKQAGTMRDVFIAGDSSPPSKTACEDKASDILTRLTDFDTRTFEESPSTPQDLNIGEKGTIDVGSPAISRPYYTYLYYFSSYTQVEGDNPANADGSIDTVEIYLAGAGSPNDTWVGTFSASGNDLTCRDSESLGSLSAGYQEISGLSIDIQTGDYIGACAKTSSGYTTIRRGDDGTHRWGVVGEYIDPSDSTTFSFYDGTIISLYGTGTEAGGPEITNTQSSWSIGVIDTSDVVYFSADNSQDDDYSQITNTGSVAVDIEIQGTDIEGGSYDWILASSNGDQQYSLYANSEGSPTVYDIEVKSSSYNDLTTNLAVSDTYDWSMKFTAPSAFNANDDGESKSATVTLVASEHT